MTVNVQIKKLIPEAVIPVYTRENDICVDLVAVSKKVVDEGQFGYIEYGTGLSIALPPRFVGRIVPRSSISDTGMILANSPGSIDPEYRGEVKVRFKWIPGTRQYEIGERIAQMSVEFIPKIEFEEVEELSVTQRGEGGFGSTGR